MSVSIPDEAREAATEATEDAFLARELPCSDADVIAERIVTAAAPHIDRAARIDELKRLTEQAEGYERWGFIEQAVDVDHVKARLVELEADA